jgi:hypothetical protein
MSRIFTANAIIINQLIAMREAVCVDSEISHGQVIGKRHVASRALNDFAAR